MDGASSGSKELAASGALLCLSNIVLLSMGDKKAAPGEIDPQDEKKSWNYWMNAKKYPVEAAIMLGTGTGLTLQTLAATFNQNTDQDLTGLSIMGAFGAFGLVLSMFPEKAKGTQNFDDTLKPLNQKHIKRAINGVETRPLTAAALTFWSGALAMFLYEYNQAGFDIEQVKPERLFAFTSSTLSNAFYMFASKRGRSEDTGMVYDISDHEDTLSPANDNF